MDQHNTTPRQGLGVDIGNPLKSYYLSLNSAGKRRFIVEMAKQNQLYPGHMSPTQLPADMIEEGKVLGAWRSRQFSAIAWPSTHPAVACRLSINRTAIDPKTGDWLGGISWDELFRIKNECGFADLDAVEVFPAADKLVNVANMRHLWVMEQRIAFGLV